MARRNALPNWPPPAPVRPVCELCGREVPQLTEHHLVPVLAGKRQGLKPQNLPTAQLCPACHKFLHLNFSIQELATEFPSIAALQANEKVSRHLGWIRKQPASKAVQVRGKTKERR